MTHRFFRWLDRRLLPRLRQEAQDLRAQGYQVDGWAQPAGPCSRRYVAGLAVNVKGRVLGLEFQWNSWPRVSLEGVILQWEALEELLRWPGPRRGTPTEWGAEIRRRLPRWFRLLHDELRKGPPSRRKRRTLTRWNPAARPAGGEDLEVYRALLQRWTQGSDGPLVLWRQTWSPPTWLERLPGFAETGGDLRLEGLDLERLSFLERVPRSEREWRSFYRSFPRGRGILCLSPVAWDEGRSRAALAATLMGSSNDVRGLARDAWRLPPCRWREDMPMAVIAVLEVQDGACSLVDELHPHVPVAPELDAATLEAGLRSLLPDLQIRCDRLEGEPAQRADLTLRDPEGIRSWIVATLPWLTSSETSRGPFGHFAPGRTVIAVEGPLTAEAVARAVREQLSLTVPLPQNGHVRGGEE